MLRPTLRYGGPHGSQDLDFRGKELYAVGSFWKDYAADYKSREFLGYELARVSVGTLTRAGANGTDVMATIVEAEAGVRFERVVYEVTLEKSDIIPVSFTAYAASEGLHELILYIDGQEVRRQEASFGLRSQ